jgi:abortive infection bacteriophage resistance protein
VSEVERSKEVFIQHFKNNYQEPLPPIWAVAEVMSLGTLSKWYKNLGPKAIRRSIADTYQIDESVLQSWLHHLVIVRNICAHHARIWNRDFTFLIQLPKHKPTHLVSELIQRSRKLYNTLVLLLHCMDIISPEHHWRQRLIHLIQQHAIPVAAMGFPGDWASRPIWQGGQA